MYDPICQIQTCESLLQIEKDYALLKLDSLSAIHSPTQDF